jgi:hypothetical protein
MAKANSKALQATTADVKTVAVTKGGKPLPKRIQTLRVILDQGGDLDEKQAAELQAWAIRQMPADKRGVFAVPSFILATGYKPPKLEQPESPELTTMHVIPAWLDDKLCSGSPMMQGGSIADILTQIDAMLDMLSDAVMAPDGGSPQGQWLTIRTIQDVIAQLIHHIHKNPLYMPKPEKRKAVSHA